MQKNMVFTSETRGYIFIVIIKFLLAYYFLNEYYFLLANPTILSNFSYDTGEEEMMPDYLIGFY